MESQESDKAVVHLTLGELCAAMELVPYDTPVRIQGFGSPLGFCAYRGYSNELAIVSTKKPKMNVGKFRQIAKAAIGATFTGWKGGDCVMSEKTPLWVVSSPGNISLLAAVGCGVVGVTQGNHGVFTIQTAPHDKYGVVEFFKKRAESEVSK